ncbi:hypothetical protein [Streptomyces sp. NPDC088812]|uniref:hypothetical protein n=1 Tax=Streptomyces sp. NPDC088812 TaxID=3365905 RepID=UPI0037FA8876
MAGAHDTLGSLLSNPEYLYASAKTNRSLQDEHAVLPARDFVHKIRTAKMAQTDTVFFVHSRTEALSSGLEIDEVLAPCHDDDTSADAILIHSKASMLKETLPKTLEAA